MQRDDSCKANSSSISSLPPSKQAKHHNAHQRQESRLFIPFFNSLGGPSPPPTPGWLAGSPTFPLDLDRAATAHTACPHAQVLSRQRVHSHTPRSWQLSEVCTASLPPLRLLSRVIIKLINCTQQAVSSPALTTRGSPSGSSRQSTSRRGPCRPPAPRASARASPWPSRRS